MRFSYMHMLKLLMALIVRLMRSYQAWLRTYLGWSDFNWSSLWQTV